jgi:hypothetical protein
MTKIDDDIRYYWLLEARKEAHLENPLVGYCKRVVFVRTGKYRKNHPKFGKRRRYKKSEVELLKFLPSGRCVQVNDIHTPGLDALAEEILSGKNISPDKNITKPT